MFKKTLIFVSFLCTFLLFWCKQISNQDIKVIQQDEVGFCTWKYGKVVKVENNSYFDWTDWFCLYSWCLCIKDFSASDTSGLVKIEYLWEDYKWINCPLYEKNKNFVFRDKKVVFWADVSTFELIACHDPYKCWCGFAKDKSFVFNQNMEIIQWVSPRWFSIFSWGNEHFYYKDNKNVFYKWKIVLGADVKTFSYITWWYRWDETKIFYEGNVIGSWNRNLLKMIGNNYASDGKSIYYFGKVIDTVIGEFHVITWNQVPDIDNFYAMDRKNVFKEGNLITWADPKTFRVIWYGYSKDLKNIYYIYHSWIETIQEEPWIWREITVVKAISWVDYSSFSIFTWRYDWYEAKDKNCFYEKGLCIKKR